MNVDYKNICRHVFNNYFVWHTYQVYVSGMELRSSGFVASTFAHVSLNVDGTGAWEMKGSVFWEYRGELETSEERPKGAKLG